MASSNIDFDSTTTMHSLVDMFIQRLGDTKPWLSEAISYCSIPHWFDSIIIQGMRPSDQNLEISADTILKELQGLPFCQEHPVHGWTFHEEIRDHLLNRARTQDNWQNLHLRAATVFRQLLDQLKVNGDDRFKSDEWRNFAAEWLHHLLHVNSSQAMYTIQYICAEALAVETSGGRWEVSFCIEFLNSLACPPSLEELYKEIELLRIGVDALSDYDDALALPVLYKLVEIPDLLPKQEAMLRDWIARIHRSYEGRLALTTKQLTKANELAPNHSWIHCNIASTHLYGGWKWGRLDLAQEYAEKAIHLKPSTGWSYSLLSEIYREQEDWDKAIENSYMELETTKSSPTGVYGDLSLIYTSTKNLTKVKELLDKAVELEPEWNYNALWRLGNAYRESRQYQKAAEQYIKAIEVDPKKIDAYLELGYLYFLLGQPTNALIEYKKVIEIEPDIALGYTWLADFYHQDGQLDRAISLCYEALEKGIVSTTLYMTLGEIYKALYQIENLKQIHNKLLNLDEGHVYAVHCMMGDALLEILWKRRKAEGAESLAVQAKNEFERAIEIDENRAWALISLAVLAIFQGNDELVRELNSRVAQNTPWAWYNFQVGLGSAYLRNYQGEEAEKILRDAVEKAPIRRDAWYGLVELYGWRGDVWGLIEIWSELVEIDATLAVDSHLSIGDAYLGISNYTQARIEFNLAKNIDPNLSTIYTRLAEVDEADNKYENAIANYKVAVTKAPGLKAFVYTQLSRIYSLQENYVEAEKSVRVASLEDSERPDSYIELARIGAIQRKTPLINEAEAQLAKVRPDKLYDLHYAVGNSYYLLGEYIQAQQEYIRCTKRAPERVEAYVALASAYVAQGLYNDAEDSLKIALNIDSTSVDVYAGFSALRYHQNDVDGVIEAEHHIVTMKPTSRLTAHWNIGLAYEKVEKFDLAEQEYRHAIQLAPWSPIGYVYLASVLHRSQRSEEERVAYIQAMEVSDFSFRDLGNYFERQNKSAEAAAVYKFGIREKPDNYELYESLIRLFTSEGQYDQAIEVCQQLARQSNAHAYNAYLILGSLLEAKESHNQAIEAYQQAIQFDPKRGDAYWSQVQLLAGRKQYDEAILACQQMAEQPELAYDAYLWIADLRIRQAKPDQALVEYQQAIQIDPTRYEGYERQIKLIKEQSYILYDEAINICKQMAQQANLEYSAQILLARIYMDQEQIEQALDAYKSATQLDPKRVAAYIEQADVLRNQGEYDKAIQICELMAQQPDLAYNAYLSIGILQIDQEQYDKAEDAFHTAINVKPELAQAYLYLANIAQSRSNWTNEEQFIRKAIEVEPDSELAFLKLAQLRERQVEWDEAVQLYRRVINLTSDPVTKSRAYYSVGSLLIGLEQFEQAEKALLWSIQIDSRNIDAYSVLGILYERQDNLSEAAKIYKKIIDLAPKSGDAYTALGRVLSHLDDSKGVEQMLQGLLAQELDTDEKYFVSMLEANSYETLNNPEKAKGSYRQAIALIPSNPQPYENLAKLLIKEDNSEEARQVYGQMAQRPELFYYTYRLAVSSFLSVHDYKQATETLLKMIEIEPKRSDGYTILAQIFLQQKYPDAALRVYELMANQPDLAYHAYLSIAAIQTQFKLEQAEETYQKAIALNKDDVSGYLQLASFYQQKGNQQFAEQYLLLAAKIAPTDSTVFVRLAQLRDIQNDKEGALSFYEKSVQVETNYREASHAYHSMGNIYLQLENLEKAEASFRKAIRLDRANTPAYVSLGILEESQKNLTRATKIYLKALEITPKYTEAYIALGNVYAQNRDIKGLNQMAQMLLEQDLQPVEQYDAHRLMAGAYRNAEFYQWAISELNNAINLMPEQYEAYGELAQIYEIQKRWERAKETYRKIMQLNPQLKAAVHYRLGQIEQINGELEAAESEFREVISILPDRVEGYQALATLLANSEQFEKAVEVYEDMVKLDLNRACSGCLDIGDSYRELGEIGHMNEVCLKVVMWIKSADSSDFKSFRLQGLAYFMQGEYTEAESALHKSLELAPNDARAHFYLALSLLCKDKTVEAIETVENGLKYATKKFEYETAIKEAEILASRSPKIEGAEELLERLKSSSDHTKQDT